MSYDLFSIYKINDLSEFGELAELLNQIETTTGKIDTNKEHMPAIIGEMAGDAITFFTSNSITAFLAAYQIGEIIKQIIQYVKSKGKTITLEKESIKYIGASNLNRGEYDENYEPIIWGPMTITDPNKLLEEEIINLSPALSFENRAFLTAFCYITKRGLARTKWQITTEFGDNIAVWYTQTIPEKAPPFLRPRKK